jgi:hypothetical protein
MHRAITTEAPSRRPRSSLRDLLSEGPVSAKDVKAEANSGLTWSTVRRAKDRMGIKPRREGFGDDGVWVWELPKVLNYLKDAHL